MRVFGISLGTVIWISLGIAVPAQQPSAQASQAVTILQQSLKLLTGGTAVNDVTLSGTAQRVAGSDDETGTAVLKALSSGESRVDLGLPSGQESEIWKNAGNLQALPAGQWIGPDGKAHTMSFHNLLTDSSWFFPVLTVSKWLSMPGYAISNVGQESWNGGKAEHLSVSLLGTAFPADESAKLQHLSQTEMYLDSTTGLPVALTFNTHPDNNELLDIPTAIHFSDYRVVSGAQVPFHITKYVNNTLFLEIRIQSATVNSGLTSTAFIIQ